MDAVEITLAGDKKFKIIADPLYHRPAKGGIKVFKQDCYDILDLSLDYEPSAEAGSLSRIPIPEGKYYLEVAEVIYAKADGLLVLRLRPKITQFGKCRGVRRSDRTSKNTTVWTEGQSLLFEVPLASNGSNNLVDIDRDLIRGRFWKLEENSEMSNLMEKDIPGTVDGGGSRAPPAKRFKYSDT